jgi:hypothetical protein
MLDKGQASFQRQMLEQLQHQDSIEAVFRCKRVAVVMLMPSVDVSGDVAGGSSETLQDIARLASLAPTSSTARARGVAIHEVDVHYTPRARVEGKKLTMIGGLRVLWTIARGVAPLKPDESTASAGQR